MGFGAVLLLKWLVNPLVENAKENLASLAQTYRCALEWEELIDLQCLWVWMNWRGQRGDCSPGSNGWATTFCI